jgi:type I restriction enzyme R subunit
MIVAYSREIAVKIYEKFLELRPSWAEKAKVVMTSGNNDPEEWKDKYFSLSKKELAKKFKDDNDPMKIAVVVDMWLTGFDVPSLATMYVYKPMSGHNLMQAIARVNRVFRDKVGGLVVDYVGIAKALKQAMNEYTKQDHENYGDPDIAKTALPKFIEKLTVCEDLFHGFDFGDFILEDDTKKEHFIREAKLLQQAQTLCRSLLDKDQRFKAAFFEAVRTAITRIVPGKKLSLREINDRINELLKQSIKTEGVIALFADAKQDFSLFDPKFLDEIAKMKQKNLAVELLKKLLAEQIAIYKRTNIVQSELFSAKLLELMKAYRNGQLTNAEVIDALVGMAHDIDANHQEGEALGLTTEEKAFYDALAKPENIKDFYDNETLVQITKELTDALRSSRTIDWQVKESARAGMRKMVKRLLKKYKYPPEGVEYATETVIKQCEQWTDNEDVVGE